MERRDYVLLARGGGGGGGGGLPRVTMIRKYKTVGYAPVHPILLVHEMS